MDRVAQRGDGRGLVLEKLVEASPRLPSRPTDTVATSGPPLGAMANRRIYRCYPLPILSITFLTSFIHSLGTVTRLPLMLLLCSPPPLRVLRAGDD